MVRVQNISVKCSQSLIFRAVFLYNQLPDIFCTYNIKIIKKYATEYIIEIYADNNIPKNEIK